MKILHISPLYFPAIGGVESLTRLIAEEMHRLGNESIVFTAKANSYDEFHQFKLNNRLLLRKELINGVDIHRFDLNPWLIALYSDSTNKMRGGWRLKNILAGRALDYWHHGPILYGFVNAIKKIKPDIVLAINDYSWTTYAACLAKRKYKIPVVFIPSTHTAYPWSQSNALKEIYKWVDCVIASTEFERNHLVNQGVTINKIKVIPHAINQKLWENSSDNSVREKYHIQKDQPVIMYLGRKIKGKGIEELIRAMQLIWKSYPEAYLILAGKIFDNFDRAVLNDILKEVDEKYTKQIINILNFKDSEIRNLYDAADIFAMPSNIDSFGLVYLEAWSRPLPVIACKNTPQESFIEHKKTGYLVDYGNVESLAEGIKYLLDNKEARISIGKNAYEQLFKEHTVEVYGQRLLDTYREVLNIKK